jgi:ABC-type amino acid transport system permease subunit
LHEATAAITLATRAGRAAAVLYARIVDGANRIGRGVLAVGVALTLGRWAVHWRHQPVLAAISTVVIVALVVAVAVTSHEHRADPGDQARPAQHVAALRAAAALCLIDAVLVVRAWSARTPLHCDCVRRAGAPALDGWGGAVIATDVALCALAVWLSRPARRRVNRP